MKEPNLLYLSIAGGRIGGFIHFPRIWSRVAWSINCDDNYYTTCSILLLDLDKHRGTLIYTNIMLYFYSSTVTLLWSWRAVGESWHTQKSFWESEQPTGTEFSHNSGPYITLKLPHDPHAHASSPLQYLFFIGHNLHTHGACSPLVTAYTHALLVFRSSLCWFYQWPDVSVNYIRRVHRWSRQYITHERLLKRIYKIFLILIICKVLNCFKYSYQIPIIIWFKEEGCSIDNKECGIFLWPHVLLCFF